MRPEALVVALGLVNWITTTIIVESELVRPLRERVRRRKLRYLLGCHLCTGTWVGLLTAAVVGGPFTGWAAIPLNGLLYKAVGHLVLEIVGRLRAA